MEIKTYFLDKQSNRFYEDIPSENGDVVLWHDVVTGPVENGADKIVRCRNFLHGQGVPESVIGSCTVPLNYPDVMLFDNGVFLQFPLRAVWDDEEATYYSIVCMQDRIITISLASSPLSGRVRQLLKSGSETPDPSAQGLLAFILDTSSDINIHYYMSARSMVENIARQLDDFPDTVGSDILVPARRAVSKLFSQFEDQYYCMATLYTLQLPQIPLTNIKADLHDIMDSQNHVARSQERLETRLRDLQHDCTLHLQRKTDYRLRLLTIFTTVCMPLSVITGIYGMNFEHMPELQWQYGYYAAIGFMGLVAAFLLFFFFKRGWFR